MFKRKLLMALTAAAIGMPMCLVINRTVLADDSGPVQGANMSDDQKKMEENFFKQAASGNTLEVRLAKLAQERSSDPQVKQTASTIESDHEQANQLLKQIASQHHIEISTEDMTPVADAVLNELQKKEGDEFTRAYVFQQVGDHAMNELMMAYTAKHGESDACREYASQMLPKIQMHLEALEMIARPMAGLNGMAEPAGARMLPDSAR